MIRMARFQLLLFFLLAGIGSNLIWTPLAVAGHRGVQPHFQPTFCYSYGGRPGMSDGGYYPTHFGIGPVSRNEARDYASTAWRDGYQWAGGCWNSNGVDDQSGDPAGQSWTEGEGGDCSGFTFKSWFLEDSWSDDRFRYWAPLTNVHGPFVAEDFKNGGPPAVSVKSKSSVTTMDAFASSGHIGMVYFGTPTPSGTDFILEAKSEADGTGVWERSYRSNGDYSGTGRTNWYVPPPAPNPRDVIQI